MDYTEVHLRRFLASTSLDAAVCMTVSNCPREEGELEKDQVVVLHRGLEYPTLSKAKKNIPIPISDYRVQLYTPSQSASGSVFLIMTFFSRLLRNVILLSRFNTTRFR